MGHTHEPNLYNRPQVGQVRPQQVSAPGQESPGRQEDVIDMALRTIETKMYGACESCGHPIPKARLRALPYARLCVSCKSGGLHRR